jgi:RNA polymerase sigma-70 factor (ECF subfamily)
VLFGLRLARRARDDADALSGRADGDLIALARDGQLDAFNELVARHERAVYAVAARYLRSAPQAEDVTQDTFVRAWRALDTFRNHEGAGFRTWLLSIAANRARDVLRAETRRPTAPLETDDEEPNWEPEAADEPPLDFAARGELSTLLERAIGALPPEQRLVVILSDVQGLPYDEVAAIAGVPVGTVKSRLNRARARLRDALTRDSAIAELLGRHGRPEGDGERG